MCETDFSEEGTSGAKGRPAFQHEKYFELNPVETQQIQERLFTVPLKCLPVPERELFRRFLFT